MLFKDLVPLTVYRGQSKCPVPKGNPVGKGEAMIVLSPSKKATIKLLSEGSFLRYQEGLYKKYYADYMYYEKIGNKQVRKRITPSEFQSFQNNKFESELQMIQKGAINTFVKTGRNVIVDTGEWHSLYFANRRKLSPLRMSEQYLDFLLHRLSTWKWDGYNRTLIIDASMWKDQLSSKITFESDNINNPITILLYLLYRKPETLERLSGLDILLFNSENHNLMLLPVDYLTKKNFNKIRSKISIIAASSLEVENIEDIDPDYEKTLIDNNLKTPEPDAELRMKLERALKNKIAKNFVGKTEEESDEVLDIPAENLDEGLENLDPNDIEISVDDPELNDEIENVVDDMIKEMDIETLEKVAFSDDAETQIPIIVEATKKVAKNVYQNKFMPEYSKVQINRIERLSAKQSGIIKPIQSKELMESKIIDVKDLNGVVNTGNKDLLSPTFANFDNSYNKKKLERDIDASVAIMSTAGKKVFITDKQVEDTSDQLTLKETRTYHLEDEDGKKMTIKFDVPKIVDDHYLYINGNKKIILHQFVAMPIIKNKKDEVKINTFYNKLIIHRVGLEDAIASPIRKFLMKNSKEFEIKLGNGSIKNSEYLQTIESNIISSRIAKFKINDWQFITAIDDMIEYCKTKGIKHKHVTESFYPIAVNETTKEVMMFDASKASYANAILQLFDEDDLHDISKFGVSKRQFYTRCEIMEKNVPIALIILHTIGLSEMLKKAGVRSNFIPKDNKALRAYDQHDYGYTEFADGYLVWEREPIDCGMLMNGVNQIDFSAYTREEMDSKDTYIFALNKYYAHSNMSYNLDQFADFMIDDTTKEILEDYHLPTTYIELLLLANKMLTTVDFIPETDMRNMRVRSNEVISAMVYKSITDAYNTYRKSSNNIYAKKISIKQNDVITRLLNSRIADEESIINPFLELEKSHAVSYKGPGGINVDRAYTVDKRAYNESMLGIAGITTSPDGNVGINRQLTLDPIITSTRGYLDFKGKNKVDELSAANLLTAGELLTPLGVEHDDPARSAMAVKQSKYMIPIDDSEPGMITNGMDRVLPYHMSKEFTIVAEDDGVVVDEVDNLVVVKYKNGRYQTIDKSPIVKKNGSAGFWIVTNMLCDKHKGDTVKKNEVIGYEKQSFKKNNDDLSATMTRGPFVKVALLPRWDCYEDSNPLTSRTSDAMMTTMAMEENAVLNPKTKVHFIAKIGDIINSGDPLLKFDEFAEDEEVQEYMNIMREKLEEEGNEFIESTSTTIKAHYTGEIVDIKIYSTVPLEDMSPSLQQIVGDYYKKLNKKINVLKKYKNEGDNQYYISGQKLSEYPEPIAADDRGLLKGERVGDAGIVFCFFIKFKDYIKKGDKITAEFALKGITSQIIEPGLEPYSEYRPDEEIGLIIAPHTPTARKTTGIFKSMFINKLLIEKKRQLTEYWNSIRPSIKM